MRHKLIVKFRSAGSPVQAKAARIESLLGGRPCRARQLFPGESEEELATLYEVELDATGPVSELLESLSLADDIEYAHEPGPRFPQG